MDNIHRVSQWAETLFFSFQYAGSHFSISVEVESFFNNKV